jgi:hypothetical protein
MNGEEMIPDMPSEDIPPHENEYVPDSVTAYISNTEPLQLIKEKLLYRVKEEIDESRIEAPIQPPAKRRGSRGEIRLIAMIVTASVIVALVGLVLADRLYQIGVQEVQAQYRDLRSTEGEILRTREAESLQRLSRVDRLIGDYLLQLEQIDRRRSLVVSEFSFALIEKSRQLENAFQQAYEGARAELVEELGEDHPSFNERLFKIETELVQEQNQQYNDFRLQRLAAFEIAQTALIVERERLDRQVNDELIRVARAVSSESELPGSPQSQDEEQDETSASPANQMDGGAGAIAASGDSESAVPSFFTLPRSVRQQIDSGFTEAAADSLDDIISAFYEDNQSFRAVNRVLEIRQEELEELVQQSAEAMRDEWYSSTDDFLDELLNGELLTDERITLLSREFGRGNPQLENALRLIARSIRSGPSDRIADFTLRFIGTVSIFADDVLVIDALVESLPEPGTNLQVHKILQDETELPIARAEVVDIYGRTIEARITQILDEENSPGLFDRIYQLSVPE